MGYKREIVYKYVTEARTDILEKRQIRFTSHRDLNDPFECRFAMEPFEQEREAAQKDGYRWETAEIEVWLEEQRQLGILSLSATPANLLMWSHYAEEHKGFVIGFDAQHSWFDEGQAYFEERIYSTTKVFLGLDGLQLVEYARDMPKTGRPREIPFGAFVTKSKDWYYEQEVRKFRHLSEATDVDGAVHLFEFPDDLVREVILGCRSSSQLADRVKELKRSSLPHLTLKKARVDGRTYALQIVGVRGG